MVETLEAKAKTGFFSKIDLWFKNFNHYLLDSFGGSNHGYHHKNVDRNKVISHSYVSSETIQEPSKIFNCYQ